MYVRLPLTSYVRCAKKIGHIANVKSNIQKTFGNVIEVLTLEELSYEWKTEEEIVDAVHKELGSIEEHNKYTKAVKKIIHSLDELNLVTIAEDIGNASNDDGISTVDFESSQIKTEFAETIMIEVTDNCNERCVHCYIPNSTKCIANSMRLCDFEKIIDEFENEGGKNVRLTGGEIFTHSEIFAMIEYCSSKNLIVGLLSNLVNLNDNDIAFIKKHVKYIQTSLYSISDDIHDSITKLKGSCEKTKLNIDKLLGAGVELSIALPIMKANMHSVLDVVKYGNERKIFVALEPLIMAQQDGNSGNLSERLSIEDTEKVMNSVCEYDFSYFEQQFRHHSTNDDRLDFNFIDYLNSDVCAIGKYYISVNPNGKYQPCTGWRTMEIGESTESMSAVWNCPKIQQLRGLKEYKFHKCVSCKASDFCVRCAKRNYYENGSIEAIIPQVCETAMLAKKIYEIHKITK